MTHQNTRFPFQKTGWLKGQRATNCCAHDILSNNQTKSALQYATVASILMAGDVGLAICSDFSCLLVRLNGTTYDLLPDAVRIKRHNNGINLSMQTRSMYNNRKNLRVQVKSGPSELIENVKLSHPFKQDIMAEITLLHETTAFAPFHTDWDTWSLPQMRFWQHPPYDVDKVHQTQGEASLLASLMGIDRSFVANMPIKNGMHLLGFAHNVSNPILITQADALINALNDPLFGPTTKYAHHHKGRTVSLRIDPDTQPPPISAHRHLQLAELAGKFTP